jgi:hypothetical protein
MRKAQRAFASRLAAASLPNSSFASQKLREYRKPPFAQVNKGFGHRFAQCASIVNFHNAECVTCVCPGGGVFFRDEKERAKVPICPPFIM